MILFCKFDWNLIIEVLSIQNEIIQRQFSISKPPEKYQKTFGFRTFSGGLEMEH